jgi:hypothetical protein
MEILVWSPQEFKQIFSPLKKNRFGTWKKPLCWDIVSFTFAHPQAGHWIIFNYAHLQDAIGRSQAKKVHTHLDFLTSTRAQLGFSRHQLQCGDTGVQQFCPNATSKLLKRIQ